MYSLNDIMIDCVKIEIPENGHGNEIISKCEMPVVKVELSQSSSNTVNHQTISLPRESIYDVPSLEEVNSQEDVLNIQISNVQGALSDQKADSEAMTVYQIENHVDGLTSQGMRHSPTFDFVNQENIPLADGFPDEQLPSHVISQENGYAAESEVQVNKSPIYNGETLNKTEKKEKEFPFQLNPRKRVHSYQQNHPFDTLDERNLNLAYQISDKSACQLGTQGSLSPYQNGTTESVPSHQMDINMVPSSSPLSSHATVPLYHMEETPTSQTGGWEKNKGYQINFYNGMPTYYGDYSFHDFKKGIPFWPPESRDLVPSNQKKAHNCNCCCHARNDASRYPALDLKNQRPSVIMVPVNWSSSDSGISHLPLKVDKTAYKLHSQSREGHWPYRDGFNNRMDYSDDSDSSDDDENRKREKYFRKNIDGTTARFKLSKEDWARIPINTFPSGGRLLSGDWTRIFLSKVKESNPWCSLRFKNNHVRSENSRKIHSAVFFRGGAECKRPECNVKVRFVIRKEKGKHVDVTYLGNICHNSQPGGGDVTHDKIIMKRDRRTYST